jgi:two-component system OmpR family sensor kinase
VIGVVLLLLGGLAWWVVRLGLRPLDRMGETAGAIAGGDLSQRVSPATERTEVGRLGLALNAMLGQIEKAFAERQASESRLRQFLADASHELRTPLASIRGYAELFRIGAARKPADTEKAMGRIEDESARMGALVENLLTLARLDQVPEAPRTPVNLSELARDAADDARAMAPDRTVSLDTDDAVTVLGDSSQLRQVLGNLVRNALMHTPPGTPIDLSVRRGEAGEAMLEVRDHGRGLPTDDTDALFERFWRADPGRGRGRGGAGLGLSIVAAIVDAHGGRVSAANAAGGGASFTIALPAAGLTEAPPAPAVTPA